MATRMSPVEALMWAAEHDPLLRSSFLNVTFLDRPLDIDRFRARLAQAAEVVSRLRQRVVDGGPGSPPEFADDPGFDLDFHVRHIALPPPGSDRQLLDLAAVLSTEAFDPARPLWQFTVVEGLAGDRGALLAKMHHTITDGVGGVRLSAMFLDLEPDAAEPLVDLSEGEPVAGEGDGSDGLFGTVTRMAGGAARQVLGAARQMAAPAEAVETARSVARQMLVTEGAHSPLWAGRRSLGRRCEVLSVDLDEVKAAAKALGGTVNDAYITGIAGGAGAYHRAKGA
ncbi:MAG: wax ester/triacylglycerol synthase family O-acyltransferase, partial [Actinomycetota bacterium]|nr:wax ester/triacylglycerol synthase family O-acyltransferase [Actinomycetota bacterium]